MAKLWQNEYAQHKNINRRYASASQNPIMTGGGARIDPEAMGLNLSVLVAIRLARHSTEGTHTAIAKRSGTAECLLVTCNTDYVLRIWVQDIDELVFFIRDVLRSIPSVAVTKTMVILKQDDQGF